MDNTAFEKTYLCSGNNSVSGVLLFQCIVVFLFSTVAHAADTVLLRNWSFHSAGADSGLPTINNDSTPLQKVQVPHSFNLNETFDTHRKGFGWYSTCVEVKPANDSDYLLECDGVCLRAKVFIDDEPAGASRHAYLPFVFDITRFLHNKEKCRIAVCVDNRLQQGDFPDHNCNGWWIYGGLIRTVRLLALPRKRIDNCQIRTRYLSDSAFELSVSYDSVNTAPDSVALSVLSPHKEMILRHQFTGGATALEIGNITPWTPENPFRYDFELTPYWNGQPGDRLHFKRGFSQLHLAAGTLRLNGKPVFLRGIGRHDVYGTKGPLLTREERCADLAAIKSTGANMLRIAHYPQHPDVYELCDSIGLLVMDEMPAWKSYPGFLGKEEGQERAAQYMSSLIRSHGNYTCIGLWCIANEIHSVKDRVALFVKYMAGFTRTADPTRLVTYTSYNYQFDKAYQYVDVVSVNEYFGWYLASIDLLPSLLATIQKECPGKPILITEFGASAAAGRFNPQATLAGPVRSMLTKDFSENFQALFHEKQIETIWKNRDICSGAMVWCYNDFMEYRKMPNDKKLPAGLNGMGIVTGDRKKKMAFTTIQNVFCRIQNEMKAAGGY